MSSRLLWILLAALALAAAVYWVFSSVEGAAPGSQSAHSPVARAESPREGSSGRAADAGNLAGPPPLGVEDETAPDRTESARTVLVLGPDDAPVHGATVLYALWPEEQWSEEWQEQMHDPSQLRPLHADGATGEAISDVDGRAKLPAHGFGIASVDQRELRGVIGFGLHRASDDGALVLRVRRWPGTELRVLRADGSPLAEEVVHLLARPRKQDQGPGRSLRYRGGWQRLVASAPTDDEGRTWLRTDLEPREERSLELDRDDLRLAVGVFLPLDETAHEEIAFGRTDPVTLRLPDQGGMRVRWSGYPEGIIPVLAPARDASESGFRVGFGATELPQPDEEDGGWVFSGLLLGRAFEVRPARGHFDEDGKLTGRGSSGLEPHRVAGPVAPGEVVEHHLSLDLDGALTGRLLRPDGKPLGSEEDPGSDLKGRALIRNAVVRGLYLSIDLASDGSVIARLYGNVEDRIQLDQVDGLFFEIQARNGIELDEETGAWGPPKNPPPPLWTHVAVDVPPGARSHDFGTVTMLNENPLLKVRVVDPAGEPVANASVALRYRLPGTPLANEDGWANASMGGDRRTNAKGEYWVIGRDWADALAFGVTPEIRIPEIERVRVVASHAEHLPTETVIPADQRDVTLTLGQAGTIAGSIRERQYNHRYVVLCVAPGTEVTSATRSQARARIGGGFMPQDGSKIPADGFTLKGIPAGSYDVVIRPDKHEAAELLRVAGLEVRPGETTEDPRLQDLDLEALLDFALVQVRDVDGTALDHDSRPRVSLLIRKPAPGGLSGGTPIWHQGRIVIPVPREARPSGILRAEGRANYLFEEIAPGEHTWQLRESSTLRLWIVGGEQLPRGAWTFRVAPPSMSFMRLQPKADADVDYEAEVTQPGVFAIRWLVGTSQGQRMVAQTDLAVTQEALDAGEIFEVRVPPQLVGWFEDQDQDQDQDQDD